MLWKPCSMSVGAEAWAESAGQSTSNTAANRVTFTLRLSLAPAQPTEADGSRHVQAAQPTGQIPIVFRGR
jgi:hypothetical protein